MRLGGASGSWPPPTSNFRRPPAWNNLPRALATRSWGLRPLPKGPSRARPPQSISLKPVFLLRGAPWFVALLEMLDPFVPRLISGLPCQISSRNATKAGNLCWSPLYLHDRDKEYVSNINKNMKECRQNKILVLFCLLV